MTREEINNTPQGSHGTYNLELSVAFPSQEECFSSCQHIIKQLVDNGEKCYIRRSVILRNKKDRIFSNRDSDKWAVFVQKPSMVREKTSSARISNSQYDVILRRIIKQRLRKQRMMRSSNAKRAMLTRKKLEGNTSIVDIRPFAKYWEWDKQMEIERRLMPRE